MTSWKKRDVGYHAANPEVPAWIVSLGPGGQKDLLGLQFFQTVRMPGNPYRGLKTIWHCSSKYTFKTSDEAKTIHQHYLGLRRIEALDKEPNIPFKIGDLITGVDRSYQRSIHRYAGLAITPEKKGRSCETEDSHDGRRPLIGTVAAHLQFVGFKGKDFIHKGTWDGYICADKVGEFYRLATDEEIGEVNEQEPGDQNPGDQNRDKRENAADA